jgi:hypothetical protein
MNGLRTAELDFNDPVNGKLILCTIENIVRVMVENHAIKLEGYKKVSLDWSAGLMDMVCARKDWEDQTKRVYFHRSYYYPKSEGPGITVSDVLRMHGWEILPRDTACKEGADVQQA